MTQDTGARDDERATYDVAAAETKWQRVWAELDPFRADDDSPREKKYALTMFPYPSGDLHMGHAEVTALHDVIARYWWQRGYEVLNPMAWDSFGLPAENAAIDVSVDSRGGCPVLIAWFSAGRPKASYPIGCRTR